MNVGTSPTSLPFLHRGGSYSSKFEASSALSSMGQYYNGRSGLPQHDIVIALTSQDMQIRGNSGPIGLAYVGGACTNFFFRTNSVALVEDRGRNSAASTTAHEIGHLLGSNHDGDRGAESCRGGWGGYIMSPSSNGATRWSQCSIRQLRNFLNNRRANCLNNAPSGGGRGGGVSNTPPSRPNIFNIISNVINTIFRF